MLITLFGGFAYVTRTLFCVLRYTKISMSSNNLLFDQANLTITKNATSVVYLWGQAVECFRCNFLQLLTIEDTQRSVTLQIDNNWNLELRDQNEIVCSVYDRSFGEHGLYNWNMSDSCSIKTEIQPHNEFYQILYTLASLTFLMLVWKYSKFVYRNRSFFFQRPSSELMREEIESNLGAPSDVHELLRQNVPPPPENSRRIKCLDAFRGITIVLMIFVNYGGGEYWFFKHSAWNGITLADFIFPWFAWIMGVGIAIKMKSDLRNSMTKLAIFKKICLRSVTLIVLGIIITNLGNDNLSTMRIFGVLQRLGLAYFIVANIELQFMKPQVYLLDMAYVVVEDFIESYRQWCIVIFLTSVHLAITFLLPLPDGCPTGYIGPGGLYDHSSQYNCTGGAAGYIDRLLFTEAHLYQSPTCQQLYKCPLPYDPEGLLGVLGTVLCVYFGLHAGRVLLVYKKMEDRLVRWLCFSFTSAIFAGILCKFTKETGFIPLNKNLWSLSYVLLSCGLAYLLLSILLVVIDKKKLWTGSPFYQAGMNSILLYIGHIITKQTFPWQWEMTDQSTHLWYFVMDLWATILWIFISFLLHKRRIFVTI